MDVIANDNNQSLIIPLESKNIPIKKHAKEIKYLLLLINIFLKYKTRASPKKVTLKKISLYFPNKEKSLPKRLKYPALKNVAGKSMLEINVSALPLFSTLNTYFKIRPNIKNKSVSTPSINTFILSLKTFQFDVANIIEEKIRRSARLENH